MKTLLCMILLLIPLKFLCITRYVSIDGSQQYTSIQTAVIASSNGDIVEVYPGEYLEYINTSGRSITIRSRYYLTQEQATIDSTIIHTSVPNPCLRVTNGESVTIDGFTMMNNFPNNLGQCLTGIGPFGGGIQVYNNASIQIQNCIIQDCIGLAAGGVYFCGVNLSMSNTIIHDNYGTISTGGILIEGYDLGMISFDTVNKNSVYNNIGFHAMDISIRSLPNPINIDLQYLSVQLTEPDYFFVTTDDINSIDLSVESPFLTLVNHDLYVSPTGNDTNTGLTQDSPLKTIAYAVRVIESDSFNPKSIFLAPGMYNFSNSQQYYPFALKSHTRLIGSSMENTIFDSEQSLRHYFGCSMQNDIRVENISFAPCIASIGPIGFGNGEDITLRNLKFDGTFGGPRIDLIYNNRVFCDNIIVTNAVINDLNLAFRMNYCDNVVLNNVLINNLDIEGDMANFMGISASEVDLTIRNSIISNCEGYDVAALFYQNIGSDQSEYNLDMSNTLIYNNVSTGSLLWSKAPVSINNRFQRMKINNCTIANNNGANSRAAYIKGDCDINNTIFSNPGTIADVSFINVYDTLTHYPTVNYSLFKHSYAASNASYVTTNNVMLNTDPLFLGVGNTQYDETMPEYYQLSSSSPCINAGTPDTLGLNIPYMDLLGNQRIWNNRIDMGCYEYGAPPVANDNPEYPALPEKIVLSTYPNPIMVNGSKGGYAYIEFTLPQKAKQNPIVEIYNLKGQKVRSIALSQRYSDHVRKAGLSEYSKQNREFYSTVFDCRNNNGQKLPSGIYLINVIADDQQTSNKITLIR